MPECIHEEVFRKALQISRRYLLSYLYIAISCDVPVLRMGLEQRSYILSGMAGSCRHIHRTACSGIHLPESLRRTYTQETQHLAGIFSRTALRNFQHFATEGMFARSSGE